MKRILVNALQEEEVRVALVDGQYLYDLDIENSEYKKKKNNIYKGVITRVEPSLEAAFVNYGQERHGFLPFKEIARSYYQAEALQQDSRPNIAEAITEGQEVIVQVIKEERGNKGATLTTFISIAGRYLVLMPNNPRAGGISRRIDGQERNELKAVFKDLKIKQGSGVIVRTAGVGKSLEELQWDLDYLNQIWGNIEIAAKAQPAPFLIYEESNIIVRVLRDHFRSDIGEIFIDKKEVYEFARTFMTKVMPHALHKLKYYSEKVPMFNRFQIETQIESAFKREVSLPSGGSIVIDPTEALISIDINSARATGGKSIEETAINANLEAADEIARQLRLRDIGGLIVIDFIDMLNTKNRREVENRLRASTKLDRARIQQSGISKFGLLEMSRQRLRPSLGESAMEVCPRCAGNRTIRSPQSLSLSIFRLLQEEALKKNTGKIVAQVPVDVATYLLNEKRPVLKKLEKHTRVQIILVPNPSLETPNYSIERFLKDAKEVANGNKLSYELLELQEEKHEPALPHEKKPQAAHDTPVVQQLIPKNPVPVRKQEPKAKNKKPGLIGKIFSVFSKDEKADAEKPEARPKPNQNNQNRRRNNNQRNRNRNRNNYKRNKKPYNNRGPNNRQRNNNKPQNNKRQNHNKSQPRKKAAGSTDKG